MLPFLKNQRAQTGLMVSMRKPDGSNELDHMDGDEDAGLKAAASDLLKAIEAKDESGIASALRSAFEILDSEPHVEGKHLDEKKE